MAREVIPRDHLASGTWPTGDLTPDAPPGAHLGQAIAQKLSNVMNERGIGHRELARLAGASHPTISATLEGTRLPTTHTLFLLEIALQVPLYPVDLFRDLHLDIRNY
ncbi:helix-turn-helix domain-containing protein [Streptomyces rhizosphaericus]|uniref:helix-turn-helix domain-containing protein n=1 Tax=Streptomyces rhizosphaericus TaxID=114699 RepID=UPI000A35D7CC|nr:helix-turn-helix transcriptional regulator [Streptomyces rhizosphaericus]